MAAFPDSKSKAGADYHGPGRAAGGGLLSEA